MAELLAFWPAPRNEDVDQIEVHRAASSGGSYARIATIDALDYYDNWVTHYHDTDATSGDWYKAIYLVEGQAVSSSPAKAGVTPYAVTPQLVIDHIQGLPANAVDAQFIQERITLAVGEAEEVIQMKLSSTQATKEIHTGQTIHKVLGLRRGRRGTRIQLRNWPVDPNSTITVYYRVRAATNQNQDVEWTDLDVQVENHNDANGMNHGQISIVARNTSIAAINPGLMLTDSRYDNVVNVLFDYTHGLLSWPGMLKDIIVRMAAAEVMEVAGQAETAGLSSRSIDGYSESYTASATTTTLSAMRMYYKDEIKRQFKYLRKPKWG